MHTSKIAMGAALLASGVIADDVPKRGLAANDDIPLTAFAGDYNGYLSQVNWQYNWNSNTAQKQDYAEFVPMLWGTQDYHTNHWFDDAWDYILNQGTTHLLGFNEPDIPSQSNMSPEDAAAAWRTYMEPFAEDARLGAPAVSNAGLQWITDFMTACNDCQIDFVPIHWYNGAGYDDDFQNWVNSICDLTGRPVWVTEVSPPQFNMNLSIADDPQVPSYRDY